MFEKERTTLRPVVEKTIPEMMQAVILQQKHVEASSKLKGPQKGRIKESLDAVMAELQQASSGKARK